MSKYSYKKIVEKANSLKTGVEKQYKLVDSSKWSYYIAKAILKPKSDIERIAFEKAPKPNGSHISNQIYKSDYIKVAEYYTEFVEKKGRMPNFVRWGDYLIRVRDYVYLFSRILVYIDKNGAYPKYANINTKCWTKPTEYPNDVFKNWVTTFKFTPKYLDDVCDYVLKHFNYQFYFDDQKSNAQVISSKSGNCTDLLQMLINMAEALEYQWKVIHTQCRQSGTGHVYGMFRKSNVNGGNWFVRDIACIADESRYCVWCEVPNGGNKLAENPNWFLANLRR